MSADKDFPKYITRTHVKALVAACGESLKNLAAMAEVVRAAHPSESERNVRADAILESLESLCVALGWHDLKALRSLVEAFPAEDVTDPRVH